MPVSAVRPVRCPALLIAAPASGQGKTSVTAALARLHRQRGRRVRVFKTGPDFLDPMVLARASGEPVHQLDLWMGGEAHCRALLHEAASGADLVLVEGVMGLHDGEPSSADLALRFGLPVLAVIDGSAMAQTFGAVALGLARYRDGLTLAGVLANRVAGESHAALLRDSLPACLRWSGSLARDELIALPERHLGLVQAGELADLDARLDRAAAALGPDAAELPPEVSFEAPQISDLRGLDSPLQGVRIAVARDAAFAFIYPANLAQLEALGAELCFFSPLNDAALPPCDAVWLPGGYPELHLDTLSANRLLHQALREHHAASRPLLAECGGLLFLLDALTDAQGRRAVMAGLLQGEAVMQARLANIGLHEATVPEGTLRGHSFHYSRLQTPLAPLCSTTPARAGRRGEAVYRSGRLTASYFHAYFPSNPRAVARLFAPDGGAR
ncbi:cobyrinate a,c-diamide synthase [Methylibium petroleiphilum]|uniref:Cobrinic acid a,c-diamide synthase n=1 Tax=Methylibium petroleiphilum (strain ATCC BAA-1232 / LMG 22953 / PM1) TaxID=420662 RepID=A2SNS3_METPP|nr:cobyrinate a,c-diamide synthase [Methylibium petroleiphilum]ABM97212.1 cobrinic acid a,c-diamide synthase [Methylibium petroleiphilum PM1]ABM97246.1 cobyrinate a,c-diamide synthase [Methylibium petroleiphilum PM1]